MSRAALSVLLNQKVRKSQRSCFPPRIVAQQCWGVDAETSRGHRRDSLGCVQASQVPQAFIVAPACCCSSVMISDIVAALGFLCQRLQVVACCEEVLWCFSSSPRSSYSLS